jgi:hypothetical protein
LIAVASRTSWVKLLKGKRGRKKAFTPDQLEAMRSELFRLLYYYGDPESERPHPEFRSKGDAIRELQAFAISEKARDFSNEHEPARTTLQPLVDQWLDEWRARPQPAAEN